MGGVLCHFTETELVYFNRQPLISIEQDVDTSHAVHNTAQDVTSLRGSV